VWHCLHQLCLGRGDVDLWEVLASTFVHQSSSALLTNSLATEPEPSLEVMRYKRMPHQTLTGLPWNLTASLVTLFTLVQAEDGPEDGERTVWDPAPLHRMIRGQLRLLFRDMEARLEEPRLRHGLQVGWSRNYLL
jgi:hypothetical protein